uniref:Uncharacterized protein n=1 Tax=Anguilla anguilla TaxID=7936 RepID=A0A0E9UIK0_ANGAN
MYSRNALYLGMSLFAKQHIQNMVFLHLIFSMFASLFLCTL